MSCASKTMKKIALLFAGQGAQAVGMGKDLSEKYPVVAGMFREADEILGRPLSKLAFEGPEEELTQTINCQPALYVHGMACLAALRHELPQFAFHATAGLSLGEFTAHAAADTFTFATGLQLVDKRSRYMQEACEATSGAMAAMIGAEENTVRDLASQADVDIANLNSPGQIVVSGEASKVAMAVTMASEHGIRRATMLKVAGAYHSRLMQSAYLQLGEALEATELQTPKQVVICNVDARPVKEAEEIRNALREQVTGTVRWIESIEYLIDQEKCDLFVECGLGGVLSGLVSRIRKGTPTISIGDAASLEAAVAKLKAEL